MIFHHHLPCSPLLPSPLPKTPAHQSAGGGKLVCLSLIFPNHCAVISPWPDHPSSAISFHHCECICWCVCVCVCWTLSCLPALYFPARNHSCFPSNRPWKLSRSLSAAAEISCLKMSVWSCVIEKQSGQEHQEVCLAFGSQFIAVDVSEDNCWQLCNPLNPTSKDDKMVGTVWQFDRLKWAAAIRRWLSLIWNSEKVYRKPVYPFPLNIFFYSVTQHSKTEYCHPMDSGLSWFKVEVFPTGTNSATHLHDAKLSHLSAAARTAGS